MASSPPEEQPSLLPPLHYTTWVLKVSIHCPGCKRKVKKVLQSIEGVYTTDIDPQQQKVIVTGNVEAETLIKKLIRNGRSAELWPEPKPILKEKKPKKNETSDDDDDEQEDDEHNNNHSEKTTEHAPQKHGVRFGNVETFTVDVKEVRPDERMPENVAVVERFPAPEQKAGGGGAGGAKKKKKKKKKKSSGNNNSANAGAGSNGAPPSSESEVSKMGPMDQTNLGHSFHHPYASPYDQNPHTSYYVPQQQQSYVVSYNAAHPMVSSGPAYYYVPSSPYMQSDIYSKQQSTPLDSFEILSDENPHACYIM